MSTREKGPEDRGPVRGRQATVGATEMELLLCCVRTRIGPAMAGQIAGLLQDDLDWDALLRIAHRHGVLPLFYRGLAATCPDAVPKQAFDRLREAFEANAASNLLYTGELLRLLALLEQRNILAVPFKGPSLAMSAYGNLALRQFGDLDILVRRQDFPEAALLMLAEGYRREPPVTAIQERVDLRSNCEASFFRPRHGMIVDLHWAFASGYFPFLLDLDEVYGRLNSIILAGRAVPVLSVEDTLLVLCMHGSKHGWDRLEWICDVAELVGREPSLEWGTVIDRARSTGSQRMLLLGLQLARRLLGTSLPRTVGDLIEADGSARTLAAQVWRRMLAGAGPVSLTSGQDRRRLLRLRYIEEPLFRLRARERLRDRWLACARTALLPNGADVGVLPLPDCLSFLYSCVRPIRLLVQYGPLLPAALGSALGRWRR